MIKKERKTININFRVEPSVKKDLEEAAVKDGRTLSGALLYIIKEYIRKFKGSKP